MTAADRREGGIRLCRRLARDVARVAPKGVGEWARAWEIVDGPSAEFMVVLTRWEATGSDDDKPPLREAYFSVLDAWRQAAVEYQRAVAEKESLR